MVVTWDTILEKEIRERSEKEFAQLAGELEETLPDFDVVFECVTSFYRSLPWGCSVPLMSRSK